MFKDHLIYCHTNLINGYKYIGQTYGDPYKRWGNNGQGYIQGKLNKRSLGQAILDYGWNNFSHEILKKNLTQEEANKREQYWIHYYNTFVENLNAKGYNLTKGGGHKENYNRVKDPVKISISILDNEYKLLEKIAQEEERNLSWTVRKAIQEYLQNHKEKEE